MPDSMETSHTDWVGRKRAKLKRSTLDCGHANTGDVHYHYWCDRLSCSKECANAGHDCGLFKGKSGIEGEAVEPEAVVDWLHAVLPEQQLTAEELVVLGNYYGSAPTSAPSASRHPFTLDPESYRALYPCTCPMVDVSTLADRAAGTTSLVQGYDPVCPVCPDPLASSVDEPVEPDPDNPHQLRHRVSRERLQELWDELGMDEPGEVECCGHTTPGLLGTRLLLCTQPVDHAGDHRDDSGCSWSELPRHSDSGRWHVIGTGDQLFEAPCDCPRPAPWWRRMLPGGGAR